jgi:hypothetical protein
MSTQRADNSGGADKDSLPRRDTINLDFSRCFPPNPVKHGCLLGIDSNGKKRVATNDGQPVTAELVCKHLNGNPDFKALGYLPGTLEGTNAGLIDLDIKNFPELGELDDARLRGLDVAEALGINVYPEQSTSGGYHIWLFTDALLNFQAMKRALKVIAQKAQLGNYEVYPSGESASGQWVIMPYAGAAKDPRRLGKTFLSTTDGEAIPFDELDEWVIRTQAEKLMALAAEYVEPHVSATPSEPVDLLPEAFEPLKKAILNPPAIFARHDCLIAAINLGERCGREQDMTLFLKSEEVRTAWVSDGSRNPSQWQAEVDRWVKAKPSLYQRGIPFLKDQGFKIPDLPKLEPEEEESDKRESVATIITKRALDSNMELWHDPEGRPWATLVFENRREHRLLKNKVVRQYLASLYYQETRKVAHSQGISDALGVLEAKAVFDGPEHPTYIRIAEIDSTIYLDLVNDLWQVIEITPNGWSVLDSAAVPVRFRRANGMLALPMPERGGNVEELAALINVPKDGRAWKIIISWLLGAFRGKPPYPILPVTGEQGSGKSTATKMLRNLIDPHVCPLRTMPRDERDLLITAKNSWGLAFDNLSGLSEATSNALCRLSTGGGMATRELYTDDEEVFLDATRPVILNGISNVIDNQDLVDRSISVNFPTIPEDKRISEAVLWQFYNTARPRILGALLDIVASGLKHLPHTTLSKLPRMADFALWITACESALGWQPGSFMIAYSETKGELVKTALESEPIVEWVMMLADQGEWEGTPTELLEKLNQLAGYEDKGKRPPKGWPSAANVLSKLLVRIAPAIRSQGVEVTRQDPKGKSRSKGWHISKVPQSTVPTDRQAETQGRNAVLHGETRVNGKAVGSLGVNGSTVPTDRLPTAKESRLEREVNGRTVGTVESLPLSNGSDDRETGEI